VICIKIYYKEKEKNPKNYKMKIQSNGKTLINCITKVKLLSKGYLIKKLKSGG
jgi:hypothetical protein